MNYPKQSDYSGDRELVPNSLRLYRHYRIRNGGLHPTFQGAESVVPGWGTARCLASEYDRASKSCQTCGGRGWVYTNRVTPVRIDNIFNPNPADAFLAEIMQDRANCDCLTNCKAPRDGCKCGFYASYSPKTNFFQQHVDAAVAARYDDSYAAIYNRGRVSLSQITSLPTIFAVVEAAGRVLMGRTGVRAERMRVVAAAIDVAHAEMSGESVYQLWPSLLAVGDTYGIKTFGANIPEMIREFPQPDLSHLIESQVTPPPPEEIMWRI